MTKSKVCKQNIKPRDGEGKERGVMRAALIASLEICRRQKTAHWGYPQYYYEVGGAGSSREGRDNKKSPREVMNKNRR